MINASSGGKGDTKGNDQKGRRHGVLIEAAH